MESSIILTFKTFTTFKTLKMAHSINTIDSVSARDFIRAGKDDISTIPYRPQIHISGYRLFVLSIIDDVTLNNFNAISKLQKIATMWSDLETKDKDFYNTVASKLKNQRFHVQNFQRKVAARCIQKAWRDFVFKIRSQAAQQIQRAWRDAWYNPKRSLCQTRLRREYADLKL
jgi:hypothetical protein